MTKHVRSSYRNHRRATWGLATVLVLAISPRSRISDRERRARTRPFTLPVPRRRGAVTPAVTRQAAATTFSSSARIRSYTSVKLDDQNTAPNAAARSADVTFPVDRGRPSDTARRSLTLDACGNGHEARASNVFARNLSLPNEAGTATFSVTLNTASSRPRPATTSRQGEAVERLQRLQRTNSGCERVRNLVVPQLTLADVRRDDQRPGLPRPDQSGVPVTTRTRRRATS